MSGSSERSVESSMFFGSALTKEENVAENVALGRGGNRSTTLSWYGH